MTMKINIKYAALSLMAVAGIATVTSCSDDESYDVYGSNNNFIYIALRIIPRASTVRCLLLLRVYMARWVLQ